MATIQNINVGTTTNDGTGDTIRNSFIKTNDNFISVNSDLSSKAPLASPTITGTLTTVNDAIINGIKVGRGGGNIVSNTAVGLNTLTANTTGICNVAIGGYALTTSSADANVAVGYDSLRINTIGTFNTAVGHFSLSKNQSGNRNVAMGFVALEENISGGSNVAIGEWALRYNQGSFCTAVGSDALYLSNSHSYSTGLGWNSQVDGSYQIQLGSGVTTCYTNGAVQNRSDLRDKTEVRDTVLGLDFVNSLRPVDYKWDMREDYRAEKPSPLAQDATEEEKNAHKILMDAWLESCKLENLTQDGTHTRTRYHHGLIAQEVQDVIEASGVDFGGFQDHKVNGGGDVLSLGYTELIAPMIKAIQELKAEIELLKAN